MKICFMSGGALGVQGTPGTYLFIERFVKNRDCLVVSSRATKHSVYTIPNSVPWLPTENLDTESTIEKALSKVEHFLPDCFYVFNFPNWPMLVAAIRKKFPDTKVVLSITTPLLQVGERRDEVQKASQESQHNLDLILTLSEESVASWINNITVPVMEYPLGIDLAMYPNAETFAARPTVSKLVYSGSLSPKRKIDKLLECFEYAVRNSKQAFELDLYGRRQQAGALQKQIIDAGLEDSIRLKGLLDHDELVKGLQNYDASVGWVPNTTYSHSPSLKSIESLAAGIPLLASNTMAHQKLAGEVEGIFLFDNEPESFATALNDLAQRGVSKETLIKNRQAIEKQDYERIISDVIFPELKRLCAGTTSIESAHDEPASNEGAEVPDQSVVRPGSIEQSLKIILVCHSMALGKGGAERVAMETAIAMGNRGHRVYMAYQNAGRPAYDSGGGVVLLPYDSIEELGDLVLSLSPDVFFVYYFDRSLTEFYKLVHGTGIPFGMQECTNPERLINISWSRPAKQPIAPCVSAWEREMVASGAHGIRVVMPGYRESFPEYIRHRVHGFSNPATPQSSAITSRNTGESQNVIINIGGVKQSKNLLTLLRAFKPLADEFPSWVIKVYGNTLAGSQPHKIKMREFIEANRLEERILFVGPTDDIFAAFADSDIHVISSLSEGCPTCVLEAMATGVPSVGFATCPGTNQLIQDGANGFLAGGDGSDNDVQSLKKCIARLMESSELRQKLGNQALVDSQNFSPDVVYDRWECLFREMSEYKRDPGRLIAEQMHVDVQLAKHASRMRNAICRSTA